MKRLAILSAVVVGAMLLASCYFMSAKTTGTIRIDFGGGLSKAITGQTVNKARVYLYSYVSSSNYSLFTFPGGLTYKESNYPGSVTLDNIPVGRWQVLVSIGSDGPNSSFSTNSYGSSGVISVVAGSDTSASVTTTASPFLDFVDAMGKNINGVIAQGNYGFLCASDASNLYYWSTIDVDPLVPGTPAADYLTIVPAPAGYQFNSVGLSANPAAGDFVLVNTNKGVETYDGTTFNKNFSQNLHDANGNPLNVLQSGTLIVSSPSSGTALFYQRDHGLGGLFLASLPASASPAYASLEDIDLSGKIVGQPVFQAAMNEDGQGYGYAFFASKLGAFWTTTDLVNSASASAGDLSSAAKFFNAPNNATVQAIAVDVPVGTASGTLYVGTPSGAYSTSITEQVGTSITFGAWTLVNATSGDSIIDIQASGGYVAFRSAYNLYVLNTSNGAVKSYPFFAGLPGTLSSMAWDSAVPALFIGGSTGIVILTSPDLP